MQIIRQSELTLAENFQSRSYLAEIAGLTAPIHTDKCSIALTRLAAGGSVVRHYHKASDEIYIFTEGRCTMCVDGAILQAGAGTVVLVEPGERHEIFPTDEPAAFYAVSISELNKKAYVHIEDWRNRPLQGGRYPYVYVDGIYLRRNWGGEYENVAILVAIAVNEDGFREVLGAAEGMKEDKASWVSFFQWLRGRGLDGVKLIVGDKCMGMLEAVGEVFPDGNSALMLVCARLRYVAGTQWGCKKYMNMKHLEAALDDASIAG